MGLVNIWQASRQQNKYLPHISAVAEKWLAGMSGPRGCDSQTTEHKDHSRSLPLRTNPLSMLEP